MHLTGANVVIVIQHQDQGHGQRVQFLDQKVGQIIRLGQGSRAQQIMQGMTRLRRNPADGSAHIAQEVRQLVVPLIQREPGHRLATTGQPLSSQGGFAKTRRRGHQNELVVQAMIQTGQQMGPPNEAGGSLRPVQFGLDQGQGVNLLIWIKHKPGSVRSVMTICGLGQEGDFNMV